MAWRTDSFPLGAALLAAAPSLFCGCHPRIDPVLDPADHLSRVESRVGPPTDSVPEESLRWHSSAGRLLSAFEWLPGATLSSDAVVMHGSSAQSWSVDGGHVTDREAHGPPYPFDFRVLESIRVQAAGSDVSVQGSGLAVNLVTRGASNRLSGEARYELTHHRLQSSNLTPDLKAQGAGFGSPVRSIAELGVDLGFPIRRGRTSGLVSAGWTRSDIGIIGFYRRSCLADDGQPLPDAAFLPRCLIGDVTTAAILTGKLEHRWNTASRTTLLWSKTDKRKPHRGASADSAPEHTNRQRSLGLAHPFQLRQNWIPSSRWLVEGRYTYSDASFVLDLQDEALRDVQGAYDRYTLASWRSGVYHRYLRRTTEVAFDASYSLPSTPARHVARFGVEFVNAPAGQVDRTGGGAVAVFDSRSGETVPYQAKLLRDGTMRAGLQQWSAYLQDAWTLPRVTIKAGLRFDRQDDTALPADIPANPMLPDLLPPVRFPGADSGVVYGNLAPRLNVAWDLSGHANSVVRASLGRYWGVGNASSRVLQPTTETRLVYWWTDGNGDGFVQRPEIELVRGFAATPTSNYNVSDPGSVRTSVTVDGALKNDLTDEWTLGFDRRVLRRLTVAASYVGRRYRQAQSTYPVEADGRLVSSDSFHPVRWAPARCPLGACCPEITYYEREEPLPPGRILRNDSQHGWHHSLEVAVRRPSANGWSLGAAVTWNHASWFYPLATRDYTDPTNIETRQGAPHSPASARWVAKISGGLTLPARLRTSLLLSARDGYPYARKILTPNRGALGSATVDIARYGSERYPGVCRLDIRLERSGRRGALRVEPALSVFNVLNSNVVLSRNPQQNSSSANQVRQVHAPRHASLELRLGW